jgi:hypothetical protein
MPPPEPLSRRALRWCVAVALVGFYASAVVFVLVARG